MKNKERNGQKNDENTEKKNKKQYEEGREVLQTISLFHKATAIAGAVMVIAMIYGNLPPLINLILAIQPAGFQVAAAIYAQKKGIRDNEDYKKLHKKVMAQKRKWKSRKKRQQ